MLRQSLTDLNLALRLPYSAFRYSYRSFVHASGVVSAGKLKSKETCAMLTARSTLRNASRLVESVIAPKSVQVVSVFAMAKTCKSNRPVTDRLHRGLCHWLRAKLSVSIENRSALELIAKCGRSLTFEIEIISELRAPFGSEFGSRRMTDSRNCKSNNMIHMNSSTSNRHYCVQGNGEVIAQGLFPYQ